MAQRRMFSKQIIETDKFLDMPLSSQALYFHLGLEADDDGFVNNARSIAKYIGANNDDLKLLATKNFIIPFNDGVIVIAHWKINNQIRKDRYTSTLYKDDFQKLSEKDQVYYLPNSPILISDGKPNGNQTATNCIPNGNQQKEVNMPSSLDNKGIKAMATKWQPNGNQTATQYSVVKSRKGKDSLGKDKDIHTLKPIQTTEPKISIYDKIITYLNRKYSMHYNSNLIPIKKTIDSRLNEGYNLDDFKTVIDKSDRLVNWNNDVEKQDALRPSKIFDKSMFEQLLRKEKPEDPFFQYQEASKNKAKDYGIESQINGVISYINKIYGSKFALNRDDASTRKRIQDAINSFGSDKELIKHLKEIHSECDTPKDLLIDLDDVPF